MLPLRFPNVQVEGRGAEAEFFKQCELQLNDDWIVIYEVRFHGERKLTGKVPTLGEIDFFLIHPKRGIFVVEVKGGKKISVEEGNWYSTPHGSVDKKPIKDPFIQSADGVINIVTYFKDKLPKIDWKNGIIKQLVVFPGHIQDGPMTLLGKRELICDKNDLTKLETTLNKVSNHFKVLANFSQQEIKQIRETLKPTFELFGSSNEEFIKANDHLEILTEQQLNVLNGLYDNKRVLVTGGAGTGKTILAFNRARELSGFGQKVLLICSNGSLARHLVEMRDSLPESNSELFQISAASHFIIRQARKSKNFPNYKGREERELAFLDSLTDDMQLNALIVDEAQSIKLEDIELIDSLINDDTSVVVFGDLNQKLQFFTTYKSALDYLKKPTKYSLTINCRNTKEIADFANYYTREPNTAHKGASGPKPKVLKKKREEIVQAAAEEFIRLANEYSLNCSQIKLLGFGNYAQKFRDWFSTNPPPKNIVQGAKKWTPNYQKIEYFQGLEADATIIVISEKDLKSQVNFQDFMRYQSKLATKIQMDRDDFEEQCKKFTDYKKSNEPVIEKFRHNLSDIDFVRENFGGSHLGENSDNLVNDFIRSLNKSFEPKWCSPNMKAKWDQLQRESLRVNLYSMVTRAKVALSIVTEPSCEILIRQEFARKSQDTIGSVAQFETDFEEVELNL